MTVSLKVLVEDTASEHLALGNEHGLSLYVETPQTVFVFDCGATGLAWENAALMHVDLGKIAFVACSHSHYDHAGGFPSLLKNVDPHTLYTGKNFWREKYGYEPESKKYTYLGAGFSAEDLKRWQISHKVCEDILQIDDYCWLVGNFERKHAFETIPPRMVCGTEGIPDDFSDEICLVVREGDGAALITGCSHPGILNIAETVYNRLKLPIYSIVGGTHLMEADEKRIEITLAELKKMKTRRLALCHCSGEMVRKRLKKDESLNGCLLSTGDMLLFE